MEEAFKIIAQEENGQYKANHTQYFGFSMSDFTATIHELNIEYKNHPIKISYDFGHLNFAKIECQLSLKAYIPNFKITKKSHYWRLFNPKANILKVSCNNISFKNFLEEQLNSSQLEACSRAHLFEPTIQKKGKPLKILTEYGLGFDNKKEVIRPLIKLYKAIIDYSV